MQIAYAVTDVRSAAHRWVERGVGPFFVRDHIAVSNSRVFGAPGAFDHSSAYGWWGEIMVELICQHEPGQAPVVGGSGVHHMAFFVDDFAVASDSLVAAGYPEAMYAEVGPMPFAFHDARDELGHFIEIYERTDRLADFYSMVRQAATDWDGSEALRSLG